jgi:hypothetical protein
MQGDLRLSATGWTIAAVFLVATIVLLALLARADRK